MEFEKVEGSGDLKKEVLRTKVLKKRKNRKIACVGKENPDFGGDRDFNFNEQKYNYFKNREDDHKVLQGVSSDNNRKILKAYLDSFCDGEIGDDQAIYKYCSAIYKMDNRWWVDRMKENGEKEMKREPDRVKEYMELAIEYWDTKLENYSNIYNVAYGEGIRRSRNAIDETVC